MSRRPCWWLAAGLVCAALATGCRCGGEQEDAGPGTGGSGEPPPLAEDTTEAGGQEVTLEITEVLTRLADATAPRSSFVTAEQMVVRARVQGGEAGLAERIRWAVKPVGAHSGPATPAEATGPELAFQGSSALPRTGSREPTRRWSTRWWPRWRWRAAPWRRSCRPPPSSARRKPTS